MTTKFFDHPTPGKPCPCALCAHLRMKRTARNWSIGFAAAFVTCLGILCFAPAELAIPAGLAAFAMLFGTVVCAAEA